MPLVSVFLERALIGGRRALAGETLGDFVFDADVVCLVSGSSRRLAKKNKSEQQIVAQSRCPSELNFLSKQESVSAFCTGLPADAERGPKPGCLGG